MLPPEIAEALTGGATVLTGNQRAARTLRELFDRERRTAGVASWDLPKILAWDGWTTGLWERLVIEGGAARLMLNRAQEQVVWRGIIEADAEVGGLAGVESLAEMAAEAWERLCAYRGETRLRGAGVSVDTKAFARWARLFEERCRAEGYLSAAQLETELARAVVAGKVELPAGGYVLVGFDRVTPAREGLVAAVRGCGVSVAALNLEVKDGECVVARAENGREELRCAARWLRERLERDPAARLALIVPGLEGRRAEVDRALRMALAPELEEITARGLPPFEFSLGVPVARTALGAAALDLLRWASGPLELERVSGLLLSPCWGFSDDKELWGRAEFDAYGLRRGKRLRPEVSLEEMVRLVEGWGRKAVENPSFAKGAKDGAPDVVDGAPGIATGLRLGRLSRALRGMRREGEVFVEGGLRAYADWMEAVRGVLGAAGWGVGADSLTFQARRRWERVLDEVATLDFTGVRVGAREALAAVAGLAEATLFAPESREAAVQVMEPLESAGSVFEGVWFLGAGELEWPVRGRVSPLLAWGLQRELGMPGASADGTFEERMTGRIAASGKTVVFSFAGVVGEGRQGVAGVVARAARERAVGLAPENPPFANGAKDGAPSFVDREFDGVGGSADMVATRELVGVAAVRGVVALEVVDDSKSLPVVPDKVIRGGAAVLQLQAACGFRAFAERRLWATSLETRETGMDARERGNAVHVALELFWKQVRSQPELVALTVEERRGILAGAVEAALGKTAGRDGSDWGVAYLDVQRTRLLELLDAWLVAEMGREVPFTVRQSETELKDVAIGPLRLSLRVDRVDETEFGDVIVDYKTGAVSHTDWLGERPEEPQLPLYAVLASGGNDLAGVAFGQVRAGKDMSLQGYQTQDGVLLKSAKLKEAGTLDEQVACWRECLTALAEDFHRGDVRVRPKSYPKTCAYCEQRLLCRLEVSLLEAGAADDTEESDAEGEGG